MSNATKFALLNSLFGILIGMYITYSSGDGYWVFIISAPISAFICGFYFWKWISKKAYINRNGKLILFGFFTGTVSHYLCWVLLSIGNNICYWVTENCTSSLGQPPAQIWQMLIYGFPMTVISLLIFGWITIPSSIGIGFLINQLNKKHTH